MQFQPLGLDDASLICQAWGSRADNFTYLSAPRLDSIAKAGHYITETLRNADSCAYHIVADKVPIGLVKAITDGHRAQVGYIIDKDYWGRGIATMAVGYITEKLLASPSIQRIWATCALANFGSIRVLEKCGYVREGVLKNWIVYPAQGQAAHDNYVYVYQGLPNNLDC